MRKKYAWASSFISELDWLDYHQRLDDRSSVVRQKGESQNGCFEKMKHVKFSEKINISYPLIRTHMCAHQGLKDVRFS